MKTPTAMAFGEEPTEKVVSIDHRRWKQHCNGLYKCRWQREFSIWHRTGIKIPWDVGKPSIDQT
jgi:hypothetical protein